MRQLILHDSKHDFIEVLDTARTKFRLKVQEHIGARYLKKHMPSNEDIPFCAKRNILKMVTAYFREDVDDSSDHSDSSSLEDSPGNQDRKLNQRDNEREWQEEACESQGA